MLNGHKLYVQCMSVQNHAVVLCGNGDCLLMEALVLSLLLVLNLCTATTLHRFAGRLTSRCFLWGCVCSRERHTHQASAAGRE